jgi:glycerophosphoryl diester phosphodiesterase
MQRLVLWAFAAAMTASISAVEIIAHRGASFDVPENTLASMKLAWEQKADAIETDLHLSKDGKIVISHDFDTARIGGTTNKIVTQTWAELQQVDAGAWKNPKFAGEKLPTFGSFLATLEKGKRIFIEIKVGPEILPEMEHVIASSGKEPWQMPIIAFGFETAVAAKKRFPRHEVSWLHSWAKDKKTGEFPKIADLIAKAKSAGLDGLDLHQGFPVSPDFVRQVKSAGLKLYVWTVDDPAMAKKWADAGVDGITTNRPKWLREQLAGK